MLGQQNVNEVTRV